MGSRVFYLGQLSTPGWGQGSRNLEAWTTSQPTRRFTEPCSPGLFVSEKPPVLCQAPPSVVTNLCSHTPGTEGSLTPQQPILSYNVPSAQRIIIH